MGQDVGTAVVAAIAAIVVAVIVLYPIVRGRPFVVYEYQKGVLYRNGRLDTIVGPGRHRLRPGSTIVPVDLRSSFLTLPGQEILTADGVTVKISLVARYRVRDVVTALHSSESYVQALYASLQVALRTAVASRTVEGVLAARGELGAEVLAATQAAIAWVGLELESVDVRDVMFTGELRKTFAKVVTAQKEGLAALERARGETAALRNLANAARLLEGNPTLLQLRALQQVGESKGNTLIMGMPPASTPIPVAGRTVEPAFAEGLPDPSDE